MHKYGHVAVKKVHLKSKIVAGNMGGPLMYVMISTNYKNELYNRFWGSTMICAKKGMYHV